MGYSTLNDAEVNWQVAYHIGLRTVEKAECGDFNPCNNPVDAWPIISGHHISIMYVEELSKWCAGKPHWVDGCEWQLDIDVVDENPLRAAMIVFLMMQEAK